MSRSSSAAARSSRADSPAGSDASSHPAPGRYRYTSDDDSYTLRYGRPAPRPTRPEPEPVRPTAPATSRPTRGRTTARISTGRYPTHQIARRDFPNSSHEQGEPSHPIGPRPRPAVPSPAYSHAPPPYYPPTPIRPPLPPQLTIHPEVRGKLDSLQTGLRSAMERLSDVDMSFNYWKEVLDDRTRSQGTTAQTHRLEDRSELARMRTMVHVFAGVAVVAVLMSILPYIFPRY